MPSGEDDANNNGLCSGRTCQDVAQDIDCQDAVQEIDCQDGQVQGMVKIKMTLDMSAATFNRVAPFIFGAVNQPPEIVVNQDIDDQEG